MEYLDVTLHQPHRQWFAARDAPQRPAVTLLDLLRERHRPDRQQKGCDRGQCGACTVLVDGRRINSCLALAVSLDSAEVITIEGLAKAATLTSGAGRLYRP